MSADAIDALNKRIICDMFEGHAPYRGRYILPDWAKALRNGSAPHEVWDRLARVMDGAMVDLKEIDETTHIQLTAASNLEVLASIEYLASIDRLYEFRLLIMPGYNDDPDTVDRTTARLRSIDPHTRIVVIGFRSHGLRPGFEYLTEASPEATARIGEQVRGAGSSDVLVV